MSDAQPADGLSSLNISACVRCKSILARRDTLRSRHAVPCGHVLCGECLGEVEAERRKRGRALCASLGCGATLDPVSTFPTAWCTQRAERIAEKLAAVLSDQGNVGDRLEPAVTGGTQGGQAPAAAGGATSIAAVEEKAATVRQALARFTMTPDAFSSGVEKWAAEETARIDVWEGREAALAQGIGKGPPRRRGPILPARAAALKTQRKLAHIKAIAEESRALVQRVRASRLEVAPGMMVQWLGLRASLEEIEQELLANVPSDPAERSAKQASLTTERERLVGLLATGKIELPSVEGVALWSKLPVLTAAFGEGKSEAAASQGPATNVPVAAAMSRGAPRSWLTRCKEERVWVGSLLCNPVAFPAMPALVRLCHCSFWTRFPLPPPLCCPSSSVWAVSCLIPSCPPGPEQSPALYQHGKHHTDRLCGPGRSQRRDWVRG